MRPTFRTWLGCLIGAALAACGSQPTRGDLHGADPCHAHVRPGPDDQLAIQSALLGAAPGSVICLEPGRYELSDGLSLGVPGLTLRGTAAGVVFDFSQQGAPAPGIDVTGDDVTVEAIALFDTEGTAIRVLGADNVRLRNLRIAWQTPRDGVAGIALLDASNTLVKDVDVTGATLAGVRASGSIRVLIDGASLLRNGTGLRIESSADVEVVGTDLQANGHGLEASAVDRLKVHNNLVEGATSLEGGAGILLRGPSTVEVHANTIRGNAGPGLRAEGLESLSIHGNRFEANGGDGATDVSLVGLPSLLCVDEEEGTQVVEESGTPLERDAGCPLPSLSPLHL